MMTRTFFSCFLARAAVAVLALTLAGCESVFDDEGDCAVSYRLTFRDDYNMLFADAFPHDIGALTVCAYNGDSTVAATFSHWPTGDRYSIDISTLTPGRTYSFVAWANYQNTPAFALTATEPGSHRAHMRMRLTDSLGVIATDIQRDGALFYGRLDSITLPKATEGDYAWELPLMRDTKTIRLLMQQVDNEPLKESDFDITITDENLVMDADNRATTAVTYRPWSLKAATADMPADAGVRSSEGTTAVSALVAELSTGRLLTSHRAVLTITYIPEQRTVVRIPLTDYLLMVKGNYNRAMSDQEYLDRQSEYTLTFFLGNGTQWLSSCIYINAWRVVLSEKDLS